MSNIELIGNINKYRRQNVYWYYCWQLLLAFTLFVLLTFLMLFIWERGIGGYGFEFTNYNKNVETITKEEIAVDTRNSKVTRRILVCYYYDVEWDSLRLLNIDGSLCTHLNIGNFAVVNSSIVISQRLNNSLVNDLPKLRQRYPKLKCLIWVGGAGDVNYAFKEMVRNHQNRKIFIKSLKDLLDKYHLDGIDIDWEFPGAYNRERQHFSQLLYEIRTEYRRERRPYLLTVAVAAVEGIAFYAYDIKFINQYVDFVNLMSYDYHFYSKWTPFTGINAPLYARPNERYLLATLNINYSVHWWLSEGVQRDKLIVGLPTYGHSFTLVNPLNRHIGAPAISAGECGQLGFASYGQICQFKDNNIFVEIVFDNATYSPYLSSGSEWISYENPLSITSKIQYIKDNDLGGAMIFALNTDDYIGNCHNHTKFPLLRIVAKAFNI